MIRVVGVKCGWETVWKSTAWLGLGLSVCAALSVVDGRAGSCEDASAPHATLQRTLYKANPQRGLLVIDRNDAIKEACRHRVHGGGVAWSRHSVAARC